MKGVIFIPTTSTLWACAITALQLISDLCNLILIPGLDATAAIELLNHLNALASSNRTVVLTIHQPRFEIFYMFHKLILLSDGKAAYHGVPKNAYAFFVEALMSSFLRKNLILPQIEEQNPAGQSVPANAQIKLHYNYSSDNVIIFLCCYRCHYGHVGEASFQTNHLGPLSGIK